MGVLARLAYNYRWSWDPDGPDVYRAVDPDRWERVAENPVKLLQEAPPTGWSPPPRTRRCSARPRAGGAGQRRPGAPYHEGSATPDRPIAYFCAEYGFHGSFPIYSGGLGALAGDILKEASDRAWPLAAVGLLYRNGYFRQRIDSGGWQHEYWVDTDPDRVPTALGDRRRRHAAHGHGAGRRDRGGVSDLAHGRRPRAAVPARRRPAENSETARWITSRLYIGDEDTRLAQYLLLGIGGVRALEAIGIEPSIVHLNEGHARSCRSSSRAASTAATARCRPHWRSRAGARCSPRTRRSRPATTPTRRTRSRTRSATSRARSASSPAEIISLGRTNPYEEAEPFGVTQFALRTSRAANGVSRRHGEVAREMWHAMWAEREVDEVPITHVTNGVHVPTWLGTPMWELLNRHLGEDWLDRATDPATWAPVDDIPAKELWDVRRAPSASS